MAVGVMTTLATLTDQVLLNESQRDRQVGERRLLPSLRGPAKCRRVDPGTKLFIAMQPNGSQHGFIRVDIGQEVQMDPKVGVQIVRQALNLYRDKLLRATGDVNRFSVSVDGATITGEDTLVIFGYDPAQDLAMALPPQARTNK